ncbi:Uncharacterized SAM-dependent O-methyltransferase [hydrothermal vent metagenome]|uniref:Uncharacterized SAM-dependent O-methyltransferase n=1 Tax=hydrothermal vent metagenome TaxID=652676 RepID=A0A3B0Y9H4_9ZZZZ
MSTQTLNLDNTLYNYLLSISPTESKVLTQLRQETESVELSIMQIAPEQGHFMSLLVKLIRAKRVIEIGTYTGYSAICMATALPVEGRLIACDISKEWTDIARRYWTLAELDSIIDLKLAPALNTLNELLADNQQESFDFIFIDADKENYEKYYERSLALLRSGGLMLIDNVLWSGKVADVSNSEAETLAIRELNLKLKVDQRIELSVLPVADGLTLVLKK